MVLAQKQKEMSSRWKCLQNKMLSLSSSLELGRYHSVMLHSALKDHGDWVRRKRGELRALQVAGDVAALQVQVEEHQGFK